MATCPLLLVVYFTAAATSIHECDSAPIDLSCRDCVIDCACLSEHNSINPEGSDRVVLLVTRLNYDSSIAGSIPTMCCALPLF